MHQVLQEHQDTPVHIRSPLSASGYDLFFADAVGSPDELAGYAFIAGQLVEPETYKQATHSLQSKEWLKAMDEEYKSLIDNKTWELQLLPRGRETLTGRWLYKIKYATDGTIKKFKACWVARGFEQQYGIDYNESFAPVV